MSWVKLDDQILAHPKIVRAGRDARDLFIAGLCYCASQLTDGVIPSAALRMLGGLADIDDPRASAQRLLDVGLWEQADDVFIVHDYLDYQPTREKAEAIRQARQQAGSKGGQISVEAKRQAKRQASASANGKQNLTPYPSPSYGENVPTERGASAPPVDASEPAMPGKNGHKPALPPRLASDTTDGTYWERILKEAPDGQRLSLLMCLAHDRIGVDNTPGGTGYARLGALAKRHGAALVAKWILQAASEHIAANPLDYLTKVANGEAKRARTNGRVKPADAVPVYTTAAESAAKVWGKTPANANRSAS